MKLSSTAIALSAVLALAGCDNSAVISPEQQMGPDPVLPAAQNFLMPPMQVPKGVGWQQNQMPKVAEGLKIDKVADGLLHPRQLLTLPNGDVLVVEANGPGTEAVSTPKQLIAGLVKGQSGKGGKGGNRITLLRPTADGSWEKHVFLEGLDSPFGVQLIGNTLYVANTGNIMQYTYQLAKRASVMRVKSWPICRTPSTTTGPRPYWPARTVKAVCRRRLQQQHHRKRPGRRVPARRRAGSGHHLWRQPCLRQRPAQPDRAAVGTAQRQAVGHRQRA